MREGNSRRGVNDKDTCVNGLCPTRQREVAVITSPVPPVEEVGSTLGVSEERVEKLKALATEVANGPR